MNQDQDQLQLEKGRSPTATIQRVDEPRHYSSPLTEEVTLHPTATILQADDLQQQHAWGQWFHLNTRKGMMSLGVGALLACLLLWCFSSIAFGGSAASRSTSLAHSMARGSQVPTLPSQLISPPTLVPTTVTTPVSQQRRTSTPTPVSQQGLPATSTPAPQLTLSITCAQAVDYQYGKVCVHTQPGAALTIAVTYCSVFPATSSSLQGTVYANGKGNYVWNWIPQTKCRGVVTAYVTASWQGQTLVRSASFTMNAWRFP